MGWRSQKSNIEFPEYHAMGVAITRGAQHTATCKHDLFIFPIHKGYQSLPSLFHLGVTIEKNTRFKLFKSGFIVTFLRVHRIRIRVIVCVK